MVASANMSGLSAPVRLSISMRTLTVRVAGSTTGAMKVTRPLNVLPFAVTVATAPFLTNGSSDS